MQNVWIRSACKLPGVEELACTESEHALFRQDTLHYSIRTVACIHIWSLRHLFVMMSTVSCT